MSTPNPVLPNQYATQAGGATSPRSSMLSRNLMNSAVPVTTIAGDGKRPYRLVRPRLFRANSVINFTWVSYEASITLTNIFLVLHGYRRLVQPPGLVA